MNAFAKRLHTQVDEVVLVRLLVLVGGAINGFAVRAIESWQINGFGSIFFGLSPFELVAMFVAASLIASSGKEATAAGAKIGPIEILAAAALLVPSSAVSWGVVAAYALYLSLQTTGRVRLGALFFLGLAATCLWSSVVLKFFAGPITTVEATPVGWILSIFKSGVVQSGNVVGVPSDYSLIVMTACTTADGLPKVLLGLAALLCFAGTLTRERFTTAAIIVAFIYAAANIVRLTIMAWSADYHNLAHGAVGANIFDTMIILLVFSIALMDDAE